MDRRRRIRESGVGVPAANQKPGSSIETTDRGQIKIKIPPQVRNNLENALVGLCDVWFEEIKPHLLRNNIKVHCQRDEGDEIGGDTKQAVCPHDILNRTVEEDDYERFHLQHEVYSASASSPPPCVASCDMCRLLLGAAGGIGRAASQAGSVHYRHSAPAPAVPATAVLLPGEPF